MTQLRLDDILKAHDKERETATENAKQQQELQRLKLEIKRDELQFKREKLEREKQREQASLKRSSTTDKHDLLLCIVSIISPALIVFMLLLVLLLC